MVEAYGLSQDAMMRNNAQRAIDNLESHCNPHCAARDFKLDVNLEALEKAADWLEGMTDPVSGRTGYSERGGYSSRSPGRHGTLYPREANEAMTAASLLCRFFLGQQSDENPILRRQAELVASKPPVWEAGKVDEYAWYLGTNAMYQFGGPHWKMWSRGLDDAVVKTQRQDGDFLGSWDPVGVWGQIGGRVFSTAMLTLTLQSYYRSSRLVR